MHAPTANLAPSQPVLMRLLVRSWEYRHPRAWAGVHFAAGVWNLFLGILLLAFAPRLGQLTWLAALPLAGTALAFWTAYRLQHSVQS
jgi:hypothetical protein